MIRKKLNNILNINNDIKGVFVPSGRVGLISSLIDKSFLKDLKIIGYDTTKNNIEYLNKNKITFLISQKSFNQGYDSIILMSDYLLKGIIPKRKYTHLLKYLQKKTLNF